MRSTDDTRLSATPHDAPPLLLASLVLGGLLLTAAVGCQSQPDDGASPQPVAEVVASDSALEVRNTVPSGWVRFRMENEGTHHHSFRLRTLPEDKTYADVHRAVLIPADSLEKALVEGRIDSASYRQELRATIPEWFSNETTIVGGITGLAPGRSAQITHNLEPGHYALSCFFRTPGRRPHVFRGVRAGLRVTEDSSGAPAPTADLTARLSPETFDVDTTALSDEQTVAFRSTGGPNDASSPFVGLFRLTGETDADAVVSWMETGIPLPVPTEWIGGPEPMPAGDVAYVRVGDLPPGRYAWMTSAAPDTTGMVKTFEAE
jgi:hypothetical protein